MTWSFELSHTGGILQGSASIESGVNVIQASNWQGKTSFLDALQMALGVSKPLTEGANSGYVRYESPTETGTVELERTDGHIERTGVPVLTDSYDRVRVELFACLGEQNDVRRAVRSGSDLKDLMLRPLDFENIEERISQLKHEREQVDAEIERAQEASKQLPTVQARVTELETKLSELRDRQQQYSDDDGDPNMEADSASRDELTKAESELARIENRIEQLEQTIEQTEQNLASKESALESITVREDTVLQSDLEDARAELQDLRRDKTVLESVHTATKMVLSEDRLDLITNVERELTGDTVACWTCGGSASREKIEEQLTGLREKMTTIQTEVDTKQTRIEELEAKRESVTQARRRKETLEADISNLHEKLSEDQQSLTNARERREELQDRVEALSQQVSEDIDELTDIESDIKYREAELEDARSDLKEIEQRAERMETLQDERDEIKSDLEEIRTRKNTIMKRTREEFDRAIQDILERFETGFETARLTANFELVVARDGHRAELDALSEGELELLGFVAALAGYEAFDVDDITPILLVDQVGGLAKQNLHTLMTYLKSRTEYLVFTAYPAYESVEAHVIEPKSWEVTSNT